MEVRVNERNSDYFLRTGGLKRSTVSCKGLNINWFSLDTSIKE
jgi:hypothetical protein